MGNSALKLLISAYIVISVLYFIDKDYARALYFVGATIISLAVIWMK
jgi:hypothetical protein